MNRDYSSAKHSMTAILSANLDKLNTCRTKLELADKIKAVFAENNLNTPASSRLIENVSCARSYDSAIKTLYNSILCGNRLGVISK